MVNVAIIGAHGKIGILATRALVAQGHRVRGIFRQPAQTDDVVAAGAEPVVLDLEHTDADRLAAALRGCDAVIFSAGAGGNSGPDRKGTVDYAGAVLAIHAARMNQTKRFVLVSYLGADVPASADATADWAAYQQAKKGADDVLRASTLDWTILRPSRLTDDVATGKVEIGDHLTGGTTSRGNVAAVIAAVLERPSTYVRVLNLVDGETPIALALTE